MASFNREYGYLFKFSDNINDNLNLMHCIQEKTYECERKPIDSNSYRDGNGVLHRNVLANIPITVSFTTVPNLTDTKIEQTWGAIIRNSYIVQNERKIHATFWVPELNDYVTQDLYVVDPKFTVNQVKKSSNGFEIVYAPVTFKFIGY